MTIVWRETTLGEVADEAGGIIQTGPFGSQLHESDYSREGTPVVMPKDILDGRIAVEAVARVSPEHVQRLAKHRLKPGDIVYGRRGDIGRQALIREGQDGWLCGTGCLRISLGDTVLDPLFLHYYLRQEYVIGWISNQAVGATMPNLNTAILRSVPARVPPLPVQRRIASILSAYDDQVENNRRRIQILEELARALYREWFVEFRFPGHDSVRRVASPLGPIPEGWRVTKLSELAETQYGYTASTDLEPVGPKYLRGMDLNKTSYIDWSQVPYCSITPEELPVYQVKKGDVVVIRMADPGKVGIVEEDVLAVFASYLIRIAPRDQRLRPSFLFHLLDSSAYQNYVSGASTGTTRKSASAGVITDFNFALPPTELVATFERRATSLRDLLTTLLRQSATLRRTRDLLLPRLLSGQVVLGDVAA